MSARARRYAWPVLFLVVLFGIAAGAGYLTAPEPSAPRTTTVTGSSGGTRGTVQALDGNILRLAVDGVAQEFTLADGVQVEVLRPVSKPSISMADWLNVGSTPNSENVFTIVGLTLIAESLVSTP